MGLSHSPNIVTDGLVLCLDAANPRSYPGSGSSWLDLSGNGNNGTIYNSLPFSTNNGGYFDFNNTSNDWYIQGTKSSPPVDSDATIEAFFYAYTNQDSCLYNQGRSGTSFSHGIRIVSGGNSLRFRNTNGDYSFSPNMTYTSSAWNHIVYASTSTETLGYINGLYVGSTLNGVKANSFNQYVIGIRAFNSISEKFYGRLAYIRIYHKQLSADEVRSNYLATKSRFGL